MRPPVTSNRRKHAERRRGSSPRSIASKPRTGARGRVLRPRRRRSLSFGREGPRRDGRRLRRRGERPRSTQGPERDGRRERVRRAHPRRARRRRRQRLRRERTRSPARAWRAPNRSARPLRDGRRRRDRDPALLQNAVAEAHAAGVVHGAIGIEHVLLGAREDGSPRAVLVDFCAHEAMSPAVAEGARRRARPRRDPPRPPHRRDRRRDAAQGRARRRHDPNPRARDEPRRARALRLGLRARRGPRALRAGARDDDPRADHPLERARHRVDAARSSSRPTPARRARARCGTSSPRSRSPPRRASPASRSMAPLLLGIAALLALFAIVLLPHRPPRSRRPRPPPTARRPRFLRIELSCPCSPRAADGLCSRGDAFRSQRGAAARPADRARFRDARD